VLHANPEWSKDHLEDSIQDVERLLLDAARQLPAAQDFQVKKAVAHRWRYALANRALDLGAVWYPQKTLALAGDWCRGSGVEDAFLSGTAAAGRIMGALGSESSARVS
jgi:predicted NAD/FAD-dependent oxidoreductase